MNLSDAGPRPWIWAVVAGLVLGAVLVAHAGLMIARAFPPDMRAGAWSSVRKRPRLAISGAVIALWTIIYALYSLAYPSAGAFPDDTVAAAANTAPAVERGAGDIPTSPSDITFDTGTVSSAGGVIDTAPTTTSTNGAAAPDAPTGGGGSTPAAPCSVEAQAQAVRDAQAAVEMLTGGPLGADGAALVEALAGCKDPTNTALSMLGVVNELLNTAGVTEPIQLPDLPGLPPFVVPEPIAAPLRPAVFDACGQILREIYTVGTVAPVLRIEFEDVVAIANYVSTACQAFAPQGAA